MRAEQKVEPLRTRAHIRCERMRSTRGAPALLIFIVLLVCILNFAWAESLWSRQGPPPPPPPPRGGPGPPRLDSRAIADHIQTLLRRLEEIKPGDQDCETLLAVARRSLDKAEEKAHSNDLFVAHRLIAASDAFLHAAGHSQLLEEGPRGPGLQTQEIAEHLQHIYFRLQQADYFAQSSGNPGAMPFPGLARKFYERALQAYDRGDWFAADQYAKTSHDTIHGLENLAQAATALPPRPR